MVIMGKLNGKNVTASSLLSESFASTVSTFYNKENGFLQVHVCVDQKQGLPST